jgi:hypothetical protein
LTLSPPTVRTNEFAVEFTNAVRGGLDRVIGKNEAESVLFHMRMEDGILDPAEFERRLVGLFGQQATTCLEREIVLDVVERLRLPIEVLESEGDFNFGEFVQAAEKAASSREP